MACEAPLNYTSDHTDCDDNDAASYPGAAEICDGKDNNCDGQIDEGVQSTFYHDADGDGYGNAADTLMACIAPENYISDHTDCDDSDAASYPGAAEICDGKDNNCDGQIDEGVQITYYHDADGDGYGNAADTLMSCEAPLNYTTDHTDCDDSDAASYPGAAEICDGKDNNCDGQIDEGVQTTYYHDADGDGYGNAADTLMSCEAPLNYTTDNTDCDDNDAASYPGAEEICDGKDNNCDAQIDEGVQITYYHDADGDGYGNAADTLMACEAPLNYTTDHTDCDDSDVASYPGAEEICDGKDNNCDGQIDEGVQITYYHDADGDGYGNEADTLMSCEAPLNYTTDNTDCDDSDALSYPGAAEICDGKDNNCDGQIDEGVQITYYHDADGDGYGNAADTLMACEAQLNYTTDHTDCDDSDAASYPGAEEICDGKDNNCDAQIDEGVQITYYLDADSDGYGNAADTLMSCEAPSNYTTDNTDCDDNDAASYSGAEEICDGKDNNCDGQIDEGVQITYYLDADSDGYGNAADTLMSCEAPSNYTTDNTDCDDNDAASYSGAEEICDGKDNNCDGQIDEGVQITYYHDADGDGYGNAADTLTNR